MVEMLVRIVAPKPRQFVAGVVLVDNRVTKAPPILRYMEKTGWTFEQVREHCRKKKWTIEIVKL